MYYTTCFNRKYHRATFLPAFCYTYTSRYNRYSTILNWQNWSEVKRRCSKVIFLMEFPLLRSNWNRTRNVNCCCAKPFTAVRLTAVITVARELPHVFLQRASPNQIFTLVEDASFEERSDVFRKFPWKVLQL